MREGTSFGPYVMVMRGPGQVPIDLTNCTLRGAVRRRATDPRVLMPLTVEVLGAPTKGRVRFGLTHQQVTVLANTEQRRNDPVRLSWGLVLEDAQGYRRSLLFGELVLQLGVVE